MQTLEKLAHSTMPFTTGGQTITDRLNAAKHSLAGSQLGKTICKATTEELMAPKKKHLDYLLHCTNEPNVSIPSMANLLIERTQNPNWVVVYKSLITIHNLMCYGNERFSQYLASCNTTFNLTNFVDKSSLQNGALAAGYDMSTHVRRYGKYVSEKIHTYRLCAFDFCKVKRGRDDGLLRTLHTDKLLKTMPILQAQLDALLEFQVNSSELNNGVISTSFILLFRDLIRLFACYNDGVINLLEKFFDMNKKQCREALDLYKAFLARLDRVSAFLSIAESVGIDRGEVPDLTRAPASLLEALESHVYHLEGGRGPPPTVPQQMVSQQIHAVHQEQLFQPQYAVDEMAKQRYLEEEKERLRQYEEQRRRQLQQQGAPTSSGPPPAPSTNPFGPPSAAAADLLFFETPPKNANPGQGDASNPFAMVAEINNRSQQGQMPFNASGPLVANPFLASAGPQPHAFPPPQPPMAPPAVNPFSAAPQPPFGYGTPNAYSQQGGGGGGGQPYWPSTTPMNTPQPGLGIYSQTPFSGTDGSYSAPSALQPNMEQAPQRPPHPPSQQQQFTPQWPPANNGTANRPTQQSDGLGRDVDTALSSLVGNLGIAGAGNGAQQRNNQQPPYGQAQPPQWPPAQYGQQQTPFGAPYPPPNGGNPYAAAGGH